MSEKTKTDYSDMYFEFMIKNFYSQINYRKNHMGKFIDMDIEDYLKSDLTRSFEQEWVWDSLTRMDIAVGSFFQQFKDEKRFSKSVQDLVTYNHKNNDVWYMCEQNKKGKFVDGTSKFMKLVKERMKALNFDKRVNDICRLLDSGVTA